MFKEQRKGEDKGQPIIYGALKNYSLCKIFKAYFYVILHTDCKDDSNARILPSFP